MNKRGLNILVAGGFNSRQKDMPAHEVEEMRQFAAALGREIIAQGHNVVTGCKNQLDKFVAKGAHEQLFSNGAADKDMACRIVSYVLRGKRPVHKYGTIIQSDRTDWDIGGLEPKAPEVIQSADVVILVGGSFGTFKAANWSRLEGKPLLPIARFGGAAKEVYGIEITSFQEMYDDRITQLEYDRVVKSLTKDWNKLAYQTLNLARKIVTVQDVFVVMSYKDSAEFTDLLSSVKRVCDKSGYHARRVDETSVHKRVIPEIMKQIRGCAFIVADVSESKPNIYYELGFADGIGKPMILTARTGTKLPFDISDLPVIFWDSFTNFEVALEDKIKSLRLADQKN